MAFNIYNKSVYLHPLNDKPQNKRIHVYDPKSYN